MSDMTPQLAWGAPNPRSYLREAPVIDRLLYRTSTSPDGCWIWQGCRDEYGYGEIGMGGDAGPTRKVHRVTYEHFVGPIPDGLTIDHLCRTPSCVNPEHLEPVPLAVNVRRGWAARPHRIAGTCRNGHDMTPENTTSGKNRCRECARERNRAYKARRRAA